MNAKRWEFGRGAMYPAPEGDWVLAQDAIGEIDVLSRKLEWLEVQAVRIMPGWVSIPETEWQQIMDEPLTHER